MTEIYIKGTVLSKILWKKWGRGGVIKPNTEYEFCYQELQAVSFGNAHSFDGIESQSNIYIFT